MADLKRSASVHPDPATQRGSDHHGSTSLICASRSRSAICRRCSATQSSACQRSLPTAACPGHRVAGGNKYSRSRSISFDQAKQMGLQPDLVRWRAAGELVKALTEGRCEPHWPAGRRATIFADTADRLTRRRKCWALPAGAGQERRPASPDAFSLWSPTSATEYRRRQAIFTHHQFTSPHDDDIAKLETTRVA